MTRQRGFVLVVVLWMLALMTIITIGVGTRAFLDRRAAAYALDQAQAKMMARGAAQRAIVEVRNKIYNDSIDGDEHVGATHFGQKWAKPMVLSRGGPLPLGENFPNDAVWFQIYDEDGRININTALNPTVEVILAAMHKKYDVMPQQVRRRINKRLLEGDHDGEPRAYFHALEEVRKLRGVDEEHWYGVDGGPGLRDLLSVYGTNKININTAPEAVLRLIPELSERDVEEIIAIRAGSDGVFGSEDDQGFNTFDELFNWTGISGDAAQALRAYGSVSSRFYRVEGYATRRNGRVRAKVRAIIEAVGNDAKLLTWEESTYAA